MPKKSIGQFIAALRKANGLTQKELAEKLNVSDKAISRWERDECAPDISLIPVIAEIFSVTCDELLCGERKPADAIKADDNDSGLSPKAEKQRQRILKSTLSELKNRSCIVIAISILGLVAAAIFNLGFNRAYLGFFAAFSFFAVAVICQIIFTNKAFFSVSDVEINVEEIDRFKTSVVNITSGMISFIVILTVFCLPLILLPDDSYLGVAGTSWLSYGALYAAPVLIIELLVYNFANMIMAKKSNQSD
ncbi:MAG: helix-turn-helix transcriptional regulator, partial [Eubacterium sp.]|nr:helix-turn-helix transcriptional regulator [Eubacterium sp.]